MHPPTGTLSVFGRSACALCKYVWLVGLLLLSGCANAAVASSEIKPASKSFIRTSFTHANGFCTTTAPLEISIAECPKYEHRTGIRREASAHDAIMSRCTVHARVGLRDFAAAVDIYAVDGDRALDRSRFVRPDPHQLLAEIGALQKPHERAGGAVEPFGDEFAMLDLALADPPRHVAQEIRMARGEIADDKASDIQALGQQSSHHG